MARAAVGTTSTNRGRCEKTRESGQARLEGRISGSANASACEWDAGVPRRRPRAEMMLNGAQTCAMGDRGAAGRRASVKELIELAGRRRVPTAAKRDHGRAPDGGGGGERGPAFPRGVEAAPGSGDKRRVAARGALKARFPKQRAAEWLARGPGPAKPGRPSRQDPKRAERRLAAMADSVGKASARRARRAIHQSQTVATRKGQAGKATEGTTHRPAGPPAEGAARNAWPKAGRLSDAG